MALQVGCPKPADVAKPLPVEPHHVTQVTGVGYELLHVIVARPGVRWSPLIPVRTVIEKIIRIVLHKLIISLAGEAGPRTSCYDCYGDGIQPREGPCAQSAIENYGTTARRCFVL